MVIVSHISMMSQQVENNSKWRHHWLWLVGAGMTSHCTLQSLQMSEAQAEATINVFTTAVTSASTQHTVHTQHTLSLTSTWQGVANHRMINKLSLIQSCLTITMETVETDHVTVCTLEDHDYIPETETGREKEREKGRERDRETGRGTERDR